VKRIPTDGDDALRSTVVGCSVTGAGLGTASLLILGVLVVFSGFSLGTCNLDFPTTPGAPVRDGLGIAVRGDGVRVVTVDSAAGFLDVIESGRLTSQVRVGGQTTDVALSPDGESALVTDTQVGQASGIVALVDLRSDEVTARIPVGSGPTGVVVSPDDRYVYVADTGYIGPGNVDVVELATDRVVDSIPVGQQPTGLALSPDGRRLYVADATLYLPLHSATTDVPGNIDVIDTTTDTVTATVPVAVAPLFVSLSSDGGRLAVGDYGSSAVTVMTTANDQTRTFPVPSGAFGVAFSPDGSHLFVCGGSSPLVDAAPGSERIGDVGTDTVSVVDSRSGLVTTTVRVDDPTGVAVTSDGAVYVAQGRLPWVTKIDPSTLALSAVGRPGLSSPGGIDAGARR
jgi:YVTN family beta-propeller protein